MKQVADTPSPSYSDCIVNYKKPEPKPNCFTYGYSCADEKPYCYLSTATGQFPSDPAAGGYKFYYCGNAGVIAICSNDPTSMTLEPPTASVPFVTPSMAPSVSPPVAPPTTPPTFTPKPSKSSTPRPTTSIATEEPMTTAPPPVVKSSAPTPSPSQTRLDVTEMPDQTNSTTDDIPSGNGIDPSVPLNEVAKPTRTPSTRLPTPTIQTLQPETVQSSSNYLAYIAVAMSLVVIVAAFIVLRRWKKQQANRGGYYLQATPKASNKNSKMKPDPIMEYVDSIKHSEELSDIWMNISKLQTAPLSLSGHLRMVSVNSIPLALKGISVVDASPRTKEEFIASIADLKGLRHQDINYIRGVAYMEYTRMLYAVTDYTNHGNINDILANPKFELSYEKKMEFCLQIAQAIQHLHSLGRVYGSLTPDKVLVFSESLRCRVSIVPLIKIPTVNSCSPSFGNHIIPYQAPELRSSNHETSMAGDVYAMGILFGQIHAQTPPFTQIYHAQGLAKGDLSIWRDPTLLPFDENQIPSNLFPILKSCWHVDPKCRPTADTLISLLSDV